MWVISQFYIPLHTVKDIQVWLSVDILHELFSPSWVLKENLQIQGVWVVTIDEFDASEFFRAVISVFWAKARCSYKHIEYLQSSLSN